MRYDTVDLAPYLVSGDNTIAVVVTYFATPNAYWAAAATNATLGGHGVFVFEARLPDGWLASDEQWLTCQTEAWSATDHEDTLAGSVPTELFDARLLAADWAQTRIRRVRLAACERVGVRSHRRFRSNTAAYRSVRTAPAADRCPPRRRDDHSREREVGRGDQDPDADLPPTTTPVGVTSIVGARASRIPP